VRRILAHIVAPPRIAAARGPPAWDDPPVAAVMDWEALAQPQPEYVFNQEVQWSPPSVVATRQRPAPPCTQAPANHPSRPLGPLREGYRAPVAPVHPRRRPPGGLAALATPLPAMLLWPPMQPPVRLNFLSLPWGITSPRSMADAAPMGSVAAPRHARRTLAPISHRVARTRRAGSPRCPRRRRGGDPRRMAGCCHFRRGCGCRPRP